MDRLLKKKISLVAAAAAVAGGPTTAAAQAQTQRGRARNFFSRSYQSDDRALRIDGDANATAAAIVPEVASIINGKPIGGPRSYMVGLHDQSSQKPVNCGGTLIAPSVVLTAAHCMDGKDGWDPLDQVLVNLYNVTDPAGVVTINIEDTSEGADIVVHPGWDYDTKVNDIALMFLPVGQVADYAKPNNDPNKPVEDDPLRVMGWGVTEFGATIASDVLLETTVTYITNEECKMFYNAEFTEESGIEITDGMMCGYQNFTGSCQGDSGGPIFHVGEDGEIGDRPTQVGIVSWALGGLGCADPRYPGVYTRVSYYEDWIKETVCSRPEHATKELCGSSKSGKGKSAKSSYAP